MEATLVILGALVLMIAAVGLFSVIAKWRNAPVGRFIDCGNVRLHYLRLFPKSMALRPPAHAEVAEETALMIPAAARLQHRYREVTCPVAAITGDGDKVVEPQQTVQLHQLLPRSVLKTIPAEIGKRRVGKEGR